MPLFDHLLPPKERERYKAEQKARNAEQDRIAKELGITRYELGMLSMACCRARMSAKPNETEKETYSRAVQAWHIEVEESKKQMDKQISELQIHSISPKHQKRFSKIIDSMKQTRIKMHGP
jgi:hypothetical protein